MKCEYCGNNLTLEDEVCPYCGKENTLASKHRQDMDKYEAEYESVKKEVLSNSRRFGGFTVRITIIAVLVALIAVLLICLGNSYGIKNMREEKKILAHIDEYRSTLDRMLDSKDFSGVYYYFYVNNLAYSEPLIDYQQAYQASNYYKDLLSYFNYLFDEGSYFEDEEAIEHIASVMERMLELRDPKSKYEIEKYYKNEKTVEYIRDLTDHSELLIRGYFGLSEEDMERFESLSKARKQLMLEEGWQNVR